ncbi:class A beta-lactamase-related serine hydrolase [Streptomyces triticagri]|uniref:Class A beta-lactamase-related serine hydrolase n=1 Tax=Streptomyces triticagri TaxID=2293568 RepID=A0A372M598_9ACTN|nr:serine hydrolase domain-containing protein [Streptomyces triticagri]RFU86108.1 class A beta-lactamase-related serine hydrolase [Streptomyces triticagri]
MPSLAGTAHGGSGALSQGRLRPGPPERAGLDPEELRLLVREVRALTEGWCAGAVVVAGRGPLLAVHEAAGWAVRYADGGRELPVERRVPMALGTPFDLASLTKLFTSVAVVQQIERGTLGIDTLVGAYLPEFTAAAEHGITVRQLLTHTSGLRPELPLYELPDDTARFAALRREEPIAEPGGRYLYSDLNMLLAQHLVERITGRRLDVLIREGITRPLGMTQTGFGPCPFAAATEDQRRPLAKLDRGMVRGRVHDENAHALGGVAGHAGLFSTGHDLAVFCRALLGGGAYGQARILGPDFVDLMLRDPGLGFRIDQPWFMGELAGRGAAGHTGFTGTSLVLDRATDTFLVLLATTVHPRRRPPDSAPRAAAATRLSRSVR